MYNCLEIKIRAYFGENCSLTCLLTTSFDAKLTTRNLARLKYFSLKLGDQNCVRFIAYLRDLAQTRKTFSLCYIITAAPPHSFQLGWQPLVQSYMNTLPDTISEENRKLITELFQWLVQPCLDFIRHECRLFVTTSPRTWSAPS